MRTTLAPGSAWTAWRVGGRADDTPSTWAEVAPAVVAMTTTGINATLLRPGARPCAAPPADPTSTSIRAPGFISLVKAADDATADLRQVADDLASVHTQRLR